MQCPTNKKHVQTVKSTEFKSQRLWWSGGVRVAHAHHWVHHKQGSEATILCLRALKLVFCQSRYFFPRKMWCIKKSDFNFWSLRRCQARIGEISVSANSILSNVTSDQPASGSFKPLWNMLQAWNSEVHIEKMITFEQFERKIYCIHIVFGWKHVKNYQKKTFHPCKTCHLKLRTANNGTTCITCRVRQVEYGTCWHDITDTSCTAGKTQQAVEGWGNPSSPSFKAPILDFYQIISGCR